MTIAISAQGTKLYRGATVASSPSTPTGFTDAIPEIKDFNGPGGTSGEVDVTSLDSTAREFIPALKDNGQFTANLNFAPSNLQQQGMINDQDQRIKRWWRLRFSDGSIADFEAFVQQFQASGGVDQALGGALTLRVSGAIRWDYAS